MSYESYRRQFSGSAFDEIIVDQLKRAPWLLISVALHGVLFALLLVFSGDPADEIPPLVTTAAFETELPPEIPEDITEPETPPDPTPEPVDDFVDDPIPLADHDESPDDSDMEECGLVGDENLDSSTELDSTANNDAIGLGAGAAGAFGGGRGGRRNTRRCRGPNPEEMAVNLGLEWLARHQSSDGAWDCDGFMANGDPKMGPLCDGRGNALYDVGVTGLSLLCFLGIGDTPKSGKYRDNVNRGLRWLRAQQDAEGCIGSRTVSNFTYNHAIATLAMVEAYGMTRSPFLKEPATRALQFCLRCQNPYKAWRYGEAGGDNDTSVTGWMVMALKSAKLAGMAIDDRPFEWARAYLDEMTDEETGRTGYVTRGGAPVREAGMQDEFPASETESLTAAAIASRIFCGEDPAGSPVIRLGVENLLSKRLPLWDRARGSIDMYYWYYGTLAMYQVGGEAWKKWNGAMVGAILEPQRKDGNFAGSWDNVGPWGDAGGRIYSTALMTLCLEVYYRYHRVFGTR